MTTYKPVGVDLGTTFSCVIFEGKPLDVIYGERVCPSVVGVDGNRLFLPTRGVPADSVKLAKRVVGRPKNDGSLEDDAKDLPFATIGDDGVMFDVQGTLIRPEEVIAFLLGKCRQAAEEAAEEGAILLFCIGVPAYYDTRQRQAIVDCASIAGIKNEVVGIKKGVNQFQLIDEPVAALADYLVSREDDGFDGKIVLVVDPGGGTVDFAAVYITRTLKGWKLVIKATAGTTRTGGVDVDREFADFVLKKAGSLPFEHNPSFLLAECETAKRELSKADRTIVAIRSRDMTQSTQVEVSKAEFTPLCKPVKNALDDAFKHMRGLSTLDWSKLHTVLIVGGSGSLPCVEEACREHVPHAPVKRSTGPEAVARGAALIASGRNIEIVQSLPRALGIEAHSGSSPDSPLQMEIILPRSAQLPIKKSRIFYTTERDQNEIDIQLIEGDQTDVSKNIPLQKMTVTGVPPGEAGKQIEVTIRVQRLGIIEATAVVLGAKKHRKSLTIHQKTRIPRALLDVLRQRNEDRLYGRHTLEEVCSPTSPTGESVGEGGSSENDDDAAESPTAASSRLTSPPSSPKPPASPYSFPADELAATPSKDHVPAPRGKPKKRPATAAAAVSTTKKSRRVKEHVTQSAGDV